MNNFLIDPVIFSLGPLQVRWYGLMYVVGFIIGTWLVKILIRDGFFKIPKEKVDGYVTTLLIGMFIGSRIFYVFIYNWGYYQNHLLEFFSVWKGGLSFHGAIVGLLGGCIVVAKKNGVPIWQVTDATVTAGAQGILWGRLGNFINGELYGRPGDVPWAMVFPGAGPYPRHPSQLYEAFFEGIVLFLVLWFLRKKVKRYGILSALFLILYGVFRYFIEFFREADAQLGYYFGGTTTMGQILCFIMILCGAFLWYYTGKKNYPVKS